jgi:glycosyltransferase involved in cell wall biosynthesis
VVQKGGRGDTSDHSSRVAFVFSRKIQYPPDIHDLKAFYISDEMRRRGLKVSWVQVGGPEKRWERDGIGFVVLRAPKRGPLAEVLPLLRLALYCITARINLVYVDEWLFLRKKPLARLANQMVLRGIGVKLVLDQRDPYLDWEIASGEISDRTKNLNRLSLLRTLLLRQTDLVITPSKAYASLYESEGMPSNKVFGMFRGIDHTLFRPETEPNTIRSRLGIRDNFVVGWFGLMHSYRMIKEIIVPLIENLSKEMPSAHLLIGGEGPLMHEFEKLLDTDAKGSFTSLGSIPYSELPSYIAACDVTICPVSTKFRFTMHSNWLKIAESISVGTPIIAARTEISELDYKDVRGVIWVDPNYQSFLSALRKVQANLASYRAEAEGQARHFESYSIGFTIPKIVDRVLTLEKTS